MGISDFESDIFISYHHGDDETPGGGDGWVTEFHRRLRVRLRQLTGVEPAIWRDTRLGAAHVLDAEIPSQVAQSALLLAIVSPGYLRSSWCKRELEAFQRAAAAGIGFQVGNALRAIRVVKTPLDGDRHREFLPSALGCEFFERQAETGFFHEFKPGSDEFEHALDRLAQEIKQVLAGLASAAARPTVYVADTTPELREQRARLCQELADRRYLVVPGAALPLDADARALAEEIGQSLGPALLSVHIFGPRYGAIPDGDERSVPVLQYDLARAAGKPLVVWIVSGADAPVPRQAQFLEGVLGAVDPHQEIVHHKSIEDVKEVVLDRISGLRSAPAAAAAPPSGDRPQIYLVCDREDHPAAGSDPRSRAQASELMQFLAEQGLSVWLPLTGETDSRRLREDHRRTLGICDAVMVYWGGASHGWFREKLRELVQAKGWGNRRLHTKALYIAAPDSPERRAYERYEELVFLQFDGFTPAPLNAFVDRVRHRPAGSGAAGSV